MKQQILHYVYQLNFVHIISKCEIAFLDINECSSSPCMNGATCTDAVNSYTCACVAGYTGTHCEIGGNLVIVKPILNIMNVKTVSAFVDVA